MPPADDDHPPHDPAARLVMMANQIATFFRHEGPARAPASIADHLRKFWDPRMRAAIIAFENSEEIGLDPLAREAVRMLK